MSCRPDAALGIGPDTCMRGAADAAQAASSLLLRLRAEGSALAQEADSRSPRVRHRSGGMAAAFNTGGHPSHGVSRLHWRAAGDVALRRAGSGAAARWLPPSTHSRHAMRPSGGRHPFRPVVQGGSRRPRGQGGRERTGALRTSSAQEPPHRALSSGASTCRLQRCRPSAGSR